MLKRLAQRVRTVLSSSRGDLLSESVVSSVVVSLMTISLVSLFMVMLTASQVAATNTSRGAWLSSELADIVPETTELVGGDVERLDDVELPGGNTTVWRWAEQVSDWEVHLKAAMPKSARYGDRAVECLIPTGTTDMAGGPTYNVADECLLEIVPVPLDLGGVGASVASTAGAGAKLLVTQVAGGITEMRYTVLVEQVTGSNPRLTFKSDSNPSAQHVIQVQGPGYYYGGLDVTGVTDLHVQGHNVVIDKDRSLIYEAPR